MKRITRWLFHALAFFSLSLFALSVFVAFRSQFYCDQLRFAIDKVPTAQMTSYPDGPLLSMFHYPDDGEGPDTVWLEPLELLSDPLGQDPYGLDWEPVGPQFAELIESEKSDPSEPFDNVILWSHLGVSCLSEPDYMTYIHFRHETLILLTALLPAVWLIWIVGRRKRLRRQAGLCVKCGYDLRGNVRPGCPECGHGQGNERRSESQHPTS